MAIAAEIQAMKQLLITLMLLALPAASLFAQEGPYVPCVGCDVFINAPYPEPGHWYNPDQSGTGFNLEFQNGVMAGYYYGYDSEGDPEWYLVTSALVRSESPGVMWELEVEPQRFTGGNCIGCPYQAPNNPEALTAIKIEFLQRAYAKLTLSDGSFQYMVPIMYGGGGKAFFAEQTPYNFPVLTRKPYPSLWTFVFNTPSGEFEFEPWRWASQVFIINEGSIEPGGPYEGMLYYRIDLPVVPPEQLVYGRILCNLEEELEEPKCTITLAGDIPTFQVSIGNFTDSRIFGESENGDTVQGFRLQYD